MEKNKTKNNTPSTTVLVKDAVISLIRPGFHAESFPFTLSHFDAVAMFCAFDYIPYGNTKNVKVATAIDDSVLPSRNRLKSLQKLHNSVNDDTCVRVGL